MSEQRPATDLMLGHLAETVKEVREHEHPERGEDLYCLNLLAYMGERMAGVLARVAEEQAKVRDLEARNTALAEEAACYLDRVSELEIEVEQERGESS